MNILVITNSTWDDRNSFGNTLSNWFGEWRDSKFSCITFRSEIPNNKICVDYYVVSPIDVAKHILLPWKIGRRYTSETIPSKSVVAEGKVVGIKGVKRRVIIHALDFLYKLPFWRNKKYKQFIQDVNPDIVFLFATADAFVCQNVKYIKSHTKAKIIISAEDDVYGAVSDSNDFLSIVQKRRYEKMFLVADKLYGASQMMCDAYKTIFNKTFYPIYKGCEFAGIRDDVNSPVEMVYAGNLLYGRLDTLSSIANSLREINKNELKIRLTVFSGTKVQKEDVLAINDGRSVVFAGQKPFEEIKDILRKADITLHVESFEPERQKQVRYSFSTKIIDCLQSGNTMMVVGPKGIASVEYPRIIPGAIVVDDINDICCVLNDIVQESNTLVKNAKLINAFAIEYHDITHVRASLKNDFMGLMDNGF